MSPLTDSRWFPVALLVGSNVFMTVAWYGHLRFTKTAGRAADSPLWLVVLVSWGIAFFEYCLMVPANRLGYRAGYSAAELKIIQEVITLVVFSGFAVTYLNEKLRWNHLAAFLCVLAAVAFARWPAKPEPPSHPPAPAIGSLNN